ncbi:MAG: IS4 family transposase [Muribaculaceae bacterium]|nr:IS4 family transposase [Muribaculaceae bacterium]
MKSAQNRHLSAVSIIRQFPFEEINEIATETEVDRRAKKIKGVNLMVDCIWAMLSSSQVSQRLISTENALPVFSEIPVLQKYSFEQISHSSLSERLDKIKIPFFEKSYDLLANKFRALVPDEYLNDMSVTRIDSTIVAETANKLKKGFSTGIKKGVAGDRRQLKYTMAYNGLDVTAARVFTKPTYSADNAPISKVVHESLRKRKDMSEFYVFDRGLKDVDDFKTIADHSQEKNVCFVGRLMKTRATECIEDLIENDSVKGDNEVEITDDYISYLRAKNSNKWDESQEYRIIKVRFKNPRPKNPKGSRRHKRHYDPEMILITNNMEAQAMDIVIAYRRRWSIEVFFKFLKQELSFSHFISTSVNGIKVMLYLTLIVSLLIKIYALNNKMGMRESKMAILNELMKYQYEQVKILQSENKRLSREVKSLKSKLKQSKGSTDH